jgi:hypothetical protein
MSQKDNPKLTVTLTDSAPVEIVKDEWPVIAEAKWKNGEFEHQSDRAYIHVRQHEDGRTLVYGAWISQWGNIPDRRGGELLPDATGVIGAIRRVAAEIEMDGTRLAQWCIADLPAEAI